MPPNSQLVYEAELVQWEDPSPDEVRKACCWKRGQGWGQGCTRQWEAALRQSAKARLRGGICSVRAPCLMKQGQDKCLQQTRQQAARKCLQGEMATLVQWAVVCGCMWLFAV